MKNFTVPLLLLIGIATTSSAQPPCPGDNNGDGITTVDEIVAAVDAALNGCPLPTATTTPPLISGDCSSNPTPKFCSGPCPAGSPECGNTIGYCYNGSCVTECTPCSTRTPIPTPTPTCPLPPAGRTCTSSETYQCVDDQNGCPICDCMATQCDPPPTCIPCHSLICAPPDSRGCTSCVCEGPTPGPTCTPPPTPCFPPGHFTCPISGCFGCSACICKQPTATPTPPMVTPGPLPTNTERFPTCCQSDGSCRRPGFGAFLCVPGETSRYAPEVCNEETGRCGAP